MRLLKLAAYGLLAYTAYQFFKGMGSSQGGGGGGGGGQQGGQQDQGNQGQQNPAQSADRSRDEIGRGPSYAPPTGQVLEGGVPGLKSGGGIEVSTGEAAGTSATHRVGRGIVH